MKDTERIAGSFAFLTLVLIADPQSCLGGSSIYLRGVVEAHCAIAVSVSPIASILPSIASGSRIIQVDAILKDCNQRSGFTLTAASAVCATAPAKGIETAPLKTLPYSVESDEPAGADKAPSVTDLAADSCSTAVASSIAVERNVDGTSTLYVNFDMN